MVLVGGFASPWPGVITSSGPTGILKEAKEVFMATINISGYKVIIDDCNYDLVKSIKWYLSFSRNNKLVYFRRHIVGTKSFVRLNRMLLGVTDRSMLVDHINGNTLDNRLSNLRTCTPSQNTMNSGISRANTTGYKGVTWNKPNRKWIAQIKACGKHLYLGSFDDPKIAYEAYCAAAKEYFGDFARFE